MYDDDHERTTWHWQWGVMRYQHHVCTFTVTHIRMSGVPSPCPHPPSGMDSCRGHGMGNLEVPVLVSWKERPWSGSYVTPTAWIQWNPLLPLITCHTYLCVPPPFPPTPWVVTPYPRVCVVLPNLNLLLCIVAAHNPERQHVLFCLSVRCMRSRVLQQHGFRKQIEFCGKLLWCWISKTVGIKSSPWLVQKYITHSLDSIFPTHHSKRLKLYKWDIMTCVFAKLDHLTWTNNAVLMRLCPCYNDSMSSHLSHIQAYLIAVICGFYKRRNVHFQWAFLFGWTFKLVFWYLRGLFRSVFSGFFFLYLSENLRIISRMGEALVSGLGSAGGGFLRNTTPDKSTLS